MKTTMKKIRKKVKKRLKKKNNLMMYDKEVS